MTRIGIIGLGFMGMIHYYGAKKVEGCQVTAICTRDPKKLSGDWSSIQGNFGPRGGIEDLSGLSTYDQIDDLLADPNVDLVDICLPTQYHKEVTIAALKAGKHVLCEKPPARNSEEAIAMAEAAEKNDKTLMYALVLRFSADAQALRKMVDDGELGQIYFGRAGYVRRRGIPIGAGAWEMYEECP